MQNRKPSLVNQLMNGLLWLTSAALGIYTIYSLYKLAGTIYALYGTDYYTGVLVGQVVAVICGLAWIIIMVIVGEYLFQHAGERLLWRLFAWLFGIEILIVFLGLFFG